MKLVFGIVIGGWIVYLELFKRSTTKDFFFLVIFQNFHNSSYSKIRSKMCEEILFRTV